MPSRRTNADKRRCVEIALREFGGMSSRAIAEMCGVWYDLVQRIKPDVTESVNSNTPTVTSTVKGSDGKTYPARRSPAAPAQEHAAAEAPTADPNPEPAPSAPKRQPVGLLLAMDAINILRLIPGGIQRPKNRVGYTVTVCQSMARGDCSKTVVTF